MALVKVWQTVVLVALAAIHAVAFAQPAPAVATEPFETEVPQLAAALEKTASSPQAREEAARRLVARHTPDAIAALRSALTDLRNPSSQLAAARALAGDLNPDPSLLDALFALLPTAQRPLNRVEMDLADAAGAALGAYRDQPDVLARLSSLASSRAVDGVRIAAMQALGHQVEKPAAEVLVRLLTSQDEPERIRTAAADALSDLTGLTGNDREASRWAKWWESVRNQSPAEFKLQQLAGRAARLDAAEEKQRTLADEATRELKAQYRTAPASERPEFLLRLLNSSSPELRILGIGNLVDDRQLALPVADAATVRLRQMIGDSNPDVRLNVANALMQLNDQAAFEPLLAQIKVEQNPEVLAALARAMGPIGDVRAAPTLIELLSNDFVIVNKAAADALRDLGARLHESDPAMASRAAAALRPLLARPGRSEALRESAADAIAELRDPAMLPELQRLLSKNESLRIHRSAIKGIGLLGMTETAGLIIPFLSDSEQGVQLEAIKQLGSLKAVEASDSLAQLTASNDPSVAGAAWTALASMLPTLSEQQLIGLEGMFDQRRQLDYKIAVLQQEVKNLQLHGNMDQMADKLQLIGRAQLELKRFAEAADNFGKALDAKLAQPSPAAGVILRLVTDRMVALLRAGNYQQAITFAQDQIARDPSLRDEPVGKEIKNEVERLAAPEQRDPAALRSALTLINLARKMTPPPAQRYMGMLNDLEQDILSRLPDAKP